MVEKLGKRVRNQHSIIKQNIEYSYQYFRKNCERFEKFRNNVFNTCLTEDDTSLLKELQMPQLEFNIGEAYLSRLRGEFSKYEPSVMIRGQDHASSDPRLVELLEGHMIALFQNNKNDNFEYDVYTDLLAGGFSVVKAYTEFESAMSFNHKIVNKRVFDPTLCGFDPMAQASHKGDGRWSFEMFPKTRDELTDMFGEDALSDIPDNVRASNGLFSWNYANYDEDIVMLVDYFCKEKKSKKIVKLVTGEVITDQEYQERLALWEQNQYFAQPPAIKGLPRVTEIDTIHQYFVIADKVLHHEAVDYKYLPHIFFDGNSQMLREAVNGGAQQMTRPYLWHAEGVQKLKNYAGALLANGLENSVRHKFMVPKKGIPPESKEAYTNVQKASVLIYNSHDPSNPEIQLPAPQAVPQIPLPPEITQAFQLVDQTTQLILGNFDADLAKLNKAQMSGVAIQEALSMSNSAAMPFVTGYLKGLNHLANVNLDLISKYYTDARTLPVYSKKKGMQEYQAINQPGGVKIDFDPDVLHIKIEAGVNFQLQKSQALQQIEGLMQVSPIFQQFVNTKGLKWLLDNIDMKGIDQLRQEAEAFMQQTDQMHQQQMKQQQNQPNPLQQKMQLEAQKLKQEKRENEEDVILRQHQLILDMQKNENERMKIMGDLNIKGQSNQAEMAKAQAETSRADAQLAIESLRLHQEMRDMRHNHDKDVVGLYHDNVDMHHRHKMEEHREQKNQDA